MRVIRLDSNNLEISTCGFSVNGRSIIASKGNGEVFFFNNIEKNHQIENFKIHESKINRIFIQKNRLFTASSDSTSVIWDLEKKKKIRILDNHLGPVLDVDVQENFIVTSDESGILKIWDQRIYKAVDEIYQGFNLNSSKFLNESMILVSSSLSSEILLWDLKNTGIKNLKLYNLKGYGKNVISTGINREKLFFFSIDSTFSIFKWSIGKSPITFQRKHFGKNKKFFQKNSLGRTFPLSFSFNGMFFSYGSSTGQTLLFSQKSGKIFKNFSDHFGIVNDISFHPRQQILCSCGNDGSLIVRDF